MIRLLLVLALALTSTAPIPLQPAFAAEAPAGGCSTHLQVEVDRPSLISADPSETTLETFRHSAGEAFNAAANALCSSGKLKPGQLAGFKRLLVQSGSGAVNTAIYTDPETLGKDTLVFQWIFDEENLGLPEQADIEEGLLCWANPEADPCLDRLP